MPIWGKSQKFFLNKWNSRATNWAGQRKPREITLITPRGRDFPLTGGQSNCRIRFKAPRFYSSELSDLIGYRPNKAYIARFSRLEFPVCSFLSYTCVLSEAKTRQEIKIRGKWFSAQPGKNRWVELQVNLLVMKRSLDVFSKEGIN